jgi:FkbM family methyltransferase
MTKKPYSEVLETHFGKILILTTDVNQGLYYKEHKKHIDQEHIDRLVSIVKNIDNPVIVDVGANLGWFSFELRNANPSATVFAFEPQKTLYNMICDSIVLNSFNNVYVSHTAIGDSNSSIKVPIFNYSLTSNFGGVELEHRGSNKEYIGQRAIKFESVNLRTLDYFIFSKLDLLKIDVEGMEEKVLLGASETIKRCKPVIFIEFLKSDSKKLKKQIEELGYEIKEILTENFLCFPIDR